MPCEQASGRHFGPTVGVDHLGHNVDADVVAWQADLPHPVPVTAADIKKRLAFQAGEEGGLAPRPPTVTSCIVVPMSNSHHLTAVGAGYVGLATAVGLASRGHTMDLVEVYAFLPYMGTKGSRLVTRQLDGVSAMIH